MSCVGILYVDEEGLRMLTGRSAKVSVCTGCEYAVNPVIPNSNLRPCGKELCKKVLDGIPMEENL